jgi:hypothetical protein
LQQQPLVQTAYDTLCGTLTHPYRTRALDTSSALLLLKHSSHLADDFDCNPYMIRFCVVAVLRGLYGQTLTPLFMVWNEFLSSLLSYNARRLSCFGPKWLMSVLHIRQASCSGVAAASPSFALSSLQVLLLEQSPRRGWNRVLRRASCLDARNCK